MSEAANRIGMWARRGVGFVLGVAVLGYCVMTGVEGGLVANPRRPQKLEDLDKLLERYVVKMQDAGALYKQAVKPPRRVAKYLGRIFPKRMQLVRGRVLFHDALKDGIAEMPEKYSKDLGALKSVDFAQFPPEYRVWVEGVTAKSAYYHSAYMYEMVGGGSAPAEMVYRQFLDKLVALQWKVDNLIYDPLLKQGIITAHRGEPPKEWFMTVGILSEKRGASDPPTTVLWRMDRMGSEDEWSYRFIGCLDYYEYDPWD